MLDVQIRVAAEAITYYHVHVIAVELSELRRRADSYVDVGLAVAKTPEPRHEPERRERRQQTHGENFAAVGSAQLRHDIGQQSKRLLRRYEQRTSRVR